MAEVENHFTVFIRLPFNRGDFIDPPPVAWSAAKERALWDILSRQAKGNEIDWRSLSERFEVTQPFLLQQAAWLYERQLSQVRAQMRRVGTRQSATPSPAPGSTTASMVGGQAMKRGGSGGSRVPSRLSTQALGSPVTGGGGGDSTPGTPAKSRSSLPFRNPSGAGPAVASQTQTQVQTRAMPGTSRPISRQSFKDPDGSTPTYTTQSRRGSIQHQLARSPGQPRSAQPQSSDSEEEMTQSRITARRPNPSSIHRRALSQRKELQHQAQRGILTNPGSVNSPRIQASDEDGDDGDDDDDDDSPSFLPFATPITEAKSRPVSSSQQDPDATLRGVSIMQQASTGSRPTMPRRTTSERIGSPGVEPPTPVQTHRPSPREPTSSTTVAQASNQTQLPTTASQPQATTGRPGLTAQKSSQNQNQNQNQNRSQNLTPNPNPLSPQHRALMQSSPRRHPGTGSDTSPSMGSSFSDLDDASVTQSALEEALLSGMGNTTMTIPGAGVAGRVSGISQALRSRYFDGQQRAGGAGAGGVSER
ncbi:hypothetical protein A1O3_03574 [Capronia epimyces CBS 606.96]|uniref:Autophagy-related protein 29 n=1 Tax=Capronia epimyces CBS 606.96 TaxID=1182542 RepID=W9YBI0_9EURO|nr:uncharacterized protein A1O3_03574 [Capronia epimyces CBS 606.96]EXJ86621.1 hypothetical protein A1O3_03574 [Capronia epimyces CBS 606.96]